MGLINYLLFLGHNFWTWTLASHPNYQDSDFSLASNKYLSEILPSSSLGLGLDEVGQKGVTIAS